MSYSLVDRLQTFVGNITGFCLQDCGVLKECTSTRKNSKPAEYSTLNINVTCTSEMSETTTRLHGVTSQTAVGLIFIGHNDVNVLTFDLENIYKFYWGCMKTATGFDITDGC
jgi:hypothetical protein